jgi:hypothetical protein
MALDPDDWRKIYVVDFTNHVWMGQRVAGPDDFNYEWHDVTTDLGAVAGVTEGSGDDNIFTIDVAVDRGATPSAADDQRILLVGGKGGVFRSIAPSSRTLVQFGARL